MRRHQQRRWKRTRLGRTRVLKVSSRMHETTHGQYQKKKFGRFAATCYTSLALGLISNEMEHSYRMLHLIGPHCAFFKLKMNTCGIATVVVIVVAPHTNKPSTNTQETEATIPQRPGERPVVSIWDIPSTLRSPFLSRRSMIRMGYRFGRSATWYGPGRVGHGE